MRCLALRLWSHSPSLPPSAIALSDRSYLLNYKSISRGNNFFFLKNREHIACSSATLKAKFYFIFSHVYLKRKEPELDKSNHTCI